MKIVDVKVMQYAVLVCAVVLSGCASNGVGLKSRAMALLDSYDEVQRKYERGEIMEARETVLSMEKTHEDYAKSQAFLKNKIEPARLRLLTYYKAKAQKAERAGDWYQAKVLYNQTAEVSIKPELFTKQADEAELRMRQKRMDILLEKRRAEDAIWQSWLDDYNVPQGLQPKDDAFKRAQSAIQDGIDARAREAVREGWRFLQKEKPGVAYVHAESALRLQPDLDRAQVLMKELKKKWPAGLKISDGKKKSKKTVAVVSHKPRPPRVVVTDKEVEALIQQGEWLKARDAVGKLKAQGGKNAEKLMEKVDAGAARVAATSFSKGMEAFRKEQIDEAVQLWNQAVTLDPDNEEYLSALTRAQQLQERLRLLKAQ